MKSYSFFVFFPCATFYNKKSLSIPPISPKKRHSSHEHLPGSSVLTPSPSPQSNIPFVKTNDTRSILSNFSHSPKTYWYMPAVALSSFPLFFPWSPFPKVLYSEFGSYLWVFWNGLGSQLWPHVILLLPCLTTTYPLPPPWRFYLNNVVMILRKSPLLSHHKVCWIRNSPFSGSDPYPPFTQFGSFIIFYLLPLTLNWNQTGACVFFALASPPCSKESVSQLFRLTQYLLPDECLQSHSFSSVEVIKVCRSPFFFFVSSNLPSICLLFLVSFF